MNIKEKISIACDTFFRELEKLEPEANAEGTGLLIEAQNKVHEMKTKLIAGVNAQQGGKDE